MTDRKAQDGERERDYPASFKTLKTQGALFVTYSYNLHCKEVLIYS